MNPTQVMKAVEENDTSAIAQILTEVDLDSFEYGTDGQSSLLHECVRLGRLAFVDELLVAGAKAKTPNSNGEIAFHIAAKFGHVEIGQLLVDQRGIGQVNCRTFNQTDQTALHLATSHGHFDFVKMLVMEFDCDIYAKATLKELKSLTAMHVAVLENQCEIAGFFAKWRRGVLLKKENSERCTPVQMAIKLGRLDCIRAIYNNGGNVNTIFPSCKMNSLQEAIYYKQGDVLKMLLSEFKMDPNVQVRGRPSVHYCIEKRMISTLQCLLENGADVNVQDSNNKGDTCLHIAARLKNSKALKLLAQQVRVNVNLVNKLGRTALALVAMEHGDLDTTKILIEVCRIDWTIKSGQGDYQGASIFQLACINGHFTMADYIYNLDKNVLNRETNGNGQNCLQLCSIVGSTLSVEYLLDKKRIKVDMRDKEGKTALHLACANDHLEIVKKLLDKTKSNDEFKLIAIETGSYMVFSHFASEEELSNVEASLEIFRNMVSKPEMSNFDSFLSLVERFTSIGVIEEPGFNGRTVLHMAAIANNVKACEELVLICSSNAVSNTNDGGMSALHFAGLLGHVEIVKKFLKHDPDLINLCNSMGSNAVHLSALAGNFNCFKIFIENGFNLTKANKINGKNLLHFAVHWIGEDFNDLPKSLREKMRQSKGLDQLHCQELLILHKNKEIENVIETRKKMAYFGKMKIVDYLLKEMPALTTTADHEGNRPIDLAAQTGNVGALKKLIDFSPENLGSRNSNGRTLLHSATLNAQFSVIVFLLESQIDFNKTCGSIDNCGTCLHILSNGIGKKLKMDNEIRRRLAIQEILLNYGIDLEVQDSNGDHPIHVSVDAAVRNENWLEAVKMLVDAGTNLEAVDSNGFTPLERASAAPGDAVNVVESLVGWGFKMNLKPTQFWEFNFKAMQLAKKSGNTNIVSFLHKKAATSRLQIDNLFR